MKIILKMLGLSLLLLHPSRARAYVYWTQEGLLASFFPGESEVESVSYTPDNAARAQLRAALGYELPRATTTIRVGRDGGEVEGYALFDSQLGQHEPIDFGVLFDAEGKVSRVEILVYREAYGDGVRADTFRRQFVGLGPSATMRPGKDIRVVSGATVSTRSISAGVRRATLIIAAWLGRPLA